MKTPSSLVLRRDPSIPILLIGSVSQTKLHGQELDLQKMRNGATVEIYTDAFLSFFLSFHAKTRWIGT